MQAQVHALMLFGFIQLAPKHPKGTFCAASFGAMQDEANEFWRPTHARWPVMCAKRTPREGIFIGALVMPTFVANSNH